MIEFDKGAESSVEIENDLKEESISFDEKVQDEEQGDSENLDQGDEHIEKDELETTQDQLHALNDKHLRLAAEYQNYRKRTIQDFSRKLEQGRSEIALTVLPVLDDLRRSLDAAENEGDPFVQGIQLVFDKFNNELSKYRIAKMDVEGELFSEEEHEALQFMAAPDGIDEGTIIAEVKPGYTIGDRVLRHAQVIVAKAMETELSSIEDESDNQEEASEDEA